MQVELRGMCAEELGMAFSWMRADQRAYADAQALCNIAPSAQARMRLNAIGKYLDQVWGRANACAGHETAHITLLQLVTPSTFKQW